MERDDVDLKNVLSKIGGDYKVLKYLGGGGFSKVYLVRHEIFGEERALKIMDTDYLLQKLKKMKNTKTAKRKYKEIRERFILEAKLYKKIEHPNIVKIYDVGVVTDKNREIEIAYLIMAYIRGVSLEEMLKNSSPFDMQKILRISENILSALDAIHQQKVLHRDIKPGNIIMEMESGEAILIDFGLAKDKLSEKDMTTNGEAVGTPPYISPEQWKGSKDLAPRTDIYSFGVVLYQMLTGDLPFKGKHSPEVMYAHLHTPVPDPREKKKDLPAGVEKVIFKALAKDEKDRYGSAKEFLHAVKDMVKKDKPKRNFAKYFIYSLVIIALVTAAFFVFKPTKDNGEKTIKPVETVKSPYMEHITSAKKFIESGDLEKAADALEKAKKINNTEEVHNLSETITKKQTENMKKEFDDLKTSLKGRANKKEKIEKFREFLDRHKNTPRNDEKKSMVSETNKMIGQLEAEVEADTKYQQYIDAVKKYIKNGNYQGAINSLNKAKEIKDTDEAKQLYDTIERNKEIENKRKKEAEDYSAIKENLNFDKYLGFKNKYPGSIHIPDLKTMLKGVDKKLPPEKYWDKWIKRNKKGYYEITFDKEHNEHIMIYIPQKNIWIDKYEVSNLQFGKFVEAEKIKLPAKTSSELIRDDNGYPAVVTYEHAEKYCKKHGLRLPKEHEWEYAAGKGKSDYPWGNQAADKGGVYRANFDSLKNGKEEDGFKGTAPVKSFEKYSSRFGVVNMIGNVKEWVQGKISKGGDFFSLKDDLKITGRMTGNKEGFRCVKEVD
jgi:serine/threonine protein kinase